MSRHFIALTPYEFQIVFVNEFTNCSGGMWVGGDDGTQTPNQDVCPSVQGGCFRSFESKRQKDIGVPVSSFIGS